jgi:2-methylcitrate dehydratase PrpD
MPTDARDATETLARYIAAAVAAPLPDAVTEKTKHHLLDTLAAMISGAHLPSGIAAIGFVRSQGGTEEAAVAGSDILTTATNAAFANAMMAHADETDDTHQRGRLHPGATMIPAALAAGEWQDSNGAALLRAIALGYDVSVRINLSLGPEFLLDSRHSTHAVGAHFGGTATAAALAGLDQTETLIALSYCMQQTGGCPSYIRDPGHIEKAFDFNAMAARNALSAVAMVKHGFTGVTDPFSSPYGFYDVFSDEPDPDQLTLELGTRWEILDGHIKKWTVGNPNQTPIESMLALIAEHGFGAGDVEHIKVELPRRRFDIANNSPMPDICMQHLLSVLLIDGTLTFASSHDAARMDDPAVRALRERFTLEINPDLDALHPARPAIVTVTLKDGRAVSHRTDAAPGTPYNPMDRDAVAAKARDLMAGVIGAEKTERLIETVFAIENLKSARDLRPLLQT